MFIRRFATHPRQVMSLFALVLTGLLMTTHQKAQAEPEQVSQTLLPLSSMTSFDSSIPTLPTVSDLDSEATEATGSEDPLGSPYPIPWNWIQQTQAEFTEKGTSGLRYYRTPSLISPDGQYGVYTRVFLEADPEMHRSRVSSVMFLENLQTGELQVIRADSPLATHLSEKTNPEEKVGIMSILMPVSWSADGNKLLSRQFEGVFNTSDACDYAVVWERQTHQTRTLSPNKVDHTTSILLGWSATDSDQVLFRAGLLGDEEWPVWSVTLEGQTALASNNESITYGQVASSPWTGVQSLK